MRCLQLRGLLPGYEKLLRLYDLQHMGKDPQIVEGAPDKIRCLSWHQKDKLLLTSFVDKSGIGWVCFHIHVAIIVETMML